MRRAKPGDSLNIAANDWNRLLDMANSGAVGARAGRGEPNLGGFGANWVYVKNTSGSDRARFDCMSLGSLVFDLQTNARQDVIFQAVAADPAKPPAILLEPIANNRFGRAVVHGLVYAKVATATSASLLYAEANASGNNLKAVAAGSIRLLAAPSVSAATLRPVLVGAGSTSLVHFKNGASSIAAFNTGTNTMTGGVVTKYNSDASGVLSSAGTTFTVYNPNPSSSIAANAYGVAELNEAGVYVALSMGGSSFDVRVKPDGTALQKTTDGGATWSDWATIRSDC